MFSSPANRYIPVKIKVGGQYVSTNTSQFERNINFLISG